MIKVLIVDDEKFIRAGLRSIIERFRPNKYVIVEAKNGEEAIGLLESQSFEIIISDIKMPKMNGLELAKNVNDSYPECKVIMLSGFSDFEYAVESMKYGVKGYLLKPVEKSKLFELLDKVESELNEAKNVNIQINEYNKNQLKYILIKDAIDYNEIKNIVDNVKIKVFDKPFFITVIDGAFNILEKFKSDFDEFYHDGLEISFYDSKKKLVLICNHNISIKRFIKEIIDYEIRFNIGISETSDNKNSVKELYQSAKSACKLSYIKSDSEICLSSSIGDKKYSIKELEKNTFKLVQKLENENNVVIGNAINAMFDNDLIELYQITYLGDLIKVMKEHLFEMLEKKLPQKYPELIMHFGDISNLNNYQNLDIYKKAVIDFTGEIIIHLRNLKDSGNDIDVAIDYIEKNYNKDINMAMVSNYVSLNYSYFSQLFKEQTGMNFVDYLKHLRIEKAKVVLKESNLKVYEVATKVGFQNPKHFMKSFKHIVGISPSEYRKKLL